jgi:hypothetical protein
VKRFVLLLMALSQCAAAVELHIQFGALERMLASRFSARRANSPCSTPAS